MDKRGDQMNLKKVLVVIFLLAVIIFLIGLYYPVNPHNQNKDKIGVVVTIAPQAEFAEQIGGDKVKVTVMVPPGADPHTYEPLPSQLKDLETAQLYLMVGSPLEFEISWMDNIRAANPRMKIINTSQGIEIIPYSLNEEGPDPHVWVSPQNAQIMVENTYQALVEIDPENKDYYQQNRDRYLQKLRETEDNINQSLQGKTNRKILVYHPSWAYFCKEFEMEQISIQKEGKEPTPQGMAQLVEQARRENIHIIFVSPQFNPASVTSIAQEIGGQVVIVDPLAKNYLENLQKVAQAFAVS